MPSILSKLGVRVGALVATVFLASCGIVEPYGSESDRLMDNWERWLSVGYSSYDFVIINDCYCATGGVPVEVRVRDDRVVDVRYASTGERLPPDLAIGYRDFDGLFQVIDDAIERRAYSINATYSLAYGYPRDVFIDYSSHVADEEYGFEIVGFYPIR